LKNDWLIGIQRIFRNKIWKNLLENLILSDFKFQKTSWSPFGTQNCQVSEGLSPFHLKNYQTLPGIRLCKILNLLFLCSKILKKTLTICQKIFHSYYKFILLQNEWYYVFSHVRQKRMVKWKMSKSSSVQSCSVHVFSKSFCNHALPKHNGIKVLLNSHQSPFKIWISGFAFKPTTLNTDQKSR